MPTATPTALFLNLAVEDLQASRTFYEALGYSVNESFSGENSIAVVVSDTIYLMLLTRPYFCTYISTEVADSHKQTEAMIGLSAESRDAVDRLTERALAAGGRFARDTQDLGFLYSRSFLDPDGHFWETLWIDPQAAQDGPPTT